MKLTDFSRVVCLSIDRRHEEWPRLYHLVESRGAELDIFLAGDGKSLTSRYDHVDTKATPSNWQGYSNSYNAFLCYQKIIHAAHAAGVETLLLLEDDVEFVENFDSILQKAGEQIIQNAVNWDMLYLGANHTWAATYEVAPNLMRLNGSVCWHAVALRRTVFETILDWTPRMAIDGMAATLHSNFGCYGVWPSIALQRPGFSHVEQRERDYSEYWGCQGNPHIRIGT